jgi:hypothetical protein
MGVSITWSETSSFGVVAMIEFTKELVISVKYRLTKVLFKNVFSAFKKVSGIL